MWRPGPSSTNPPTSDGEKDGGFEGVDIRADPAESEVPQIKIIAKSEARHRKRSVFIVVQSLPQIPLDNHMPSGVQFL